MSTLKKAKTSKTKVSDDLLNAGSGKTIKQPNVNDDKLTTITEMRQQTNGQTALAIEDEQRRPIRHSQHGAQVIRLVSRRLEARGRRQRCLNVKALRCEIPNGHGSSLSQIARDAIRQPGPSAGLAAACPPDNAWNLVCSARLAGHRLANTCAANDHVDVSEGDTRS